jgi:hypothetical protein
MYNPLLEKVDIGNEGTYYVENIEDNSEAEEIFAICFHNRVFSLYVIFRCLLSLFII